jgi:hypothetical protein
LVAAAGRRVVRGAVDARGRVGDMVIEANFHPDSDEAPGKLRGRPRPSRTRSSRPAPASTEPNAHPCDSLKRASPSVS